MTPTLARLMLRLDRMGRDYAVNHARHEYNEVETDEERSYTEGNTPTEDTHPPEPGPPEEFGTQRPQSRG